MQKSRIFHKNQSKFYTLKFSKDKQSFKVQKQDSQLLSMIDFIKNQCSFSLLQKYKYSGRRISTNAINIIWYKESLYTDSTKVRCKINLKSHNRTATATFHHF